MWKIDHEFENTRMKIEEYRGKIAKIFNDLEVISGGWNALKSMSYALCLSVVNLLNTAIQLSKWLNQVKLEVTVAFEFKERYYLSEEVNLDERKLQKVIF